MHYSLVLCDTVVVYEGLATSSAAELLVVMNGQHVFDKMLFMIVSYAANFVAKIYQIFVNMFFVILEANFLTELLEMLQPNGRLFS